MIKRFNKKENLGITLIALVITIIILLILAGISIAQLTGNGLFEKAKIAKEISKNSQEDEEDKIKQYGNEIDNYVGGSRYTNLGDESEVLWTGNISTLNQTASWTKSIEGYSYLILQARWNDTKAIQDWLIDVKTIKEEGYYPTNYSYRNSHILINMHADYYMYLSFTSNKSLIIPEINSNALVHLVKIIGIK